MHQPGTLSLAGKLCTKRSVSDAKGKGWVIDNRGRKTNWPSLLPNSTPPSFLVRNSNLRWCPAQSDFAFSTYFRSFWPFCRFKQQVVMISLSDGLRRSKAASESWTCWRDTTVVQSVTLHHRALLNVKTCHYQSLVLDFCQTSWSIRHSGQLQSLWVFLQSILQFRFKGGCQRFL